ncbi:OST-HTH/LOTUS domain-containing protein [Pseudomonas aeruginosa]|uniref:OST-HTH/LOTUS domain-containing protein n=1 Tax=Pseudomonas aeruginosa TaxID=287 RepID=UPI00106A14D0|nr:OST-HTH/LOTUS domain-containing protein [Pseudomonas aeruginosa]HBO9019087.1 hypothetical protein [Pseudomonas aeruginosa]HEH9487698.1 hypothetical protein [Pseudomonas aeruginosa]
MDELAQAKQLIIQLLSSEPSEYCARLKQRLNIRLLSMGLPPFDERKHGSKKFSQFLASQFDDRLTLEKPDGAGDIRVSLKHPAPRAHAVSSAPASKREPGMAIRSDIWQAFTNPDEKRKRYFHRLTGDVVHFLESGDEGFRQKVEAAPHQYIEIEFIPSATLQEWMAEFLGLLDLHGHERAPLDSLVAMDYSSSVNKAFTKALGEREGEWRRIRTLKITERIKAWATQHNVKHDDLTYRHTPVALSAGVFETPAPVMTPLQQATRLLEKMSDEDILSVAIPVLLSNLLSKSQI